MWVSFHFADGGEGWEAYRAAFLRAYARAVSSPTRHVITCDGGLLRSRMDWLARNGESMFLRAPWCTLGRHDYLQRITDTNVFLITAAGATLSQLRAVHLELLKDPTYIGALEVDPAYGPQWVIYIDSLQHRFRVWGSHLTRLHTIDDELFDNELDPCVRLACSRMWSSSPSADWRRRSTVEAPPITARCWDSWKIERWII